MASLTEKVPANHPCCICAGTASELVHEADYSAYGYPGTFALRRCSTCGLLFNSPRLPDDAFPQLYDGNYYFFRTRVPAEFDRVREMWDRAVAPVADRVPQKEVLEVGSAKGYLLAVMQRMGWEVQGVELSPQAARFASDRLGVPTFTGSIEEWVAAGGRRFPLVLAIDVIEHVLDPRRFAEALARAVEPGGTLVVDTPNGGAANIESVGESWKGFNPFHVFLFDRGNLKALLGAAGFVVEEQFSYGNAPASPAPEGARGTGRAVVRQVLEGLGVLGGVRRVRDRVLEGRDLRAIPTLVERAAGSVAGSAGYPATEDAGLPLSRGCRGDNLVTVARRT